MSQQQALNYVAAIKNSVAALRETAELIRQVSSTAEVVAIITAKGFPELAAVAGMVYWSTARLAAFVEGIASDIDAYADLVADVAKDNPSGVTIAAYCSAEWFACGANIVGRDTGVGWTYVPRSGIGAYLVWTRFFGNEPLSPNSGPFAPGAPTHTVNCDPKGKVADCLVD